MIVGKSMFLFLDSFFGKISQNVCFAKKKSWKSPADEYLVYFYEPIKFIELSENWASM